MFSYRYDISDQDNSFMCLEYFDNLKIMEKINMNKFKKVLLVAPVLLLSIANAKNLQIKYSINNTTSQTLTYKETDTFTWDGFQQSNMVYIAPYSGEKQQTLNYNEDAALTLSGFHLNGEECLNGHHTTHTTNPKNLKLKVVKSYGQCVVQSYSSWW